MSEIIKKEVYEYNNRHAEVINEITEAMMKTKEDL